MGEDLEGYTDAIGRNFLNAEEIGAISDTYLAWTCQLDGFATSSLERESAHDARHLAGTGFDL